MTSESEYPAHACMVGALSSFYRVVGGVRQFQINDLVYGFFSLEIDRKNFYLY